MLTLAIILCLTVLDALAKDKIWPAPQTSLYQPHFSQLAEEVEQVMAMLDLEQVTVELGRRY